MHARAAFWDFQNDFLQRSLEMYPYNILTSAALFKERKDRMKSTTIATEKIAYEKTQHLCCWFDLITIDKLRNKL